MKRIALYFRVSTDDQTTEPQRIELREYCTRRGWENVTEYADKISGSKFTRLGLNRLMTDVRKHRVDAVVCVKMDRLGRSLSHMAQLLAELESHNVALICPGQGIDTSDDNPAGKLQRGILMCVAEFERDLIRERTMAGLAAARARGSRLGRPMSELSVTVIEEITAFLSKVSGAATSYAELASRTSMSKSNLFNICNRARAVWHGMKARCSNPKHESFANYGGRGIKVCPRWEVFENFVSDMGIAPAQGLSIDRRDNDGDYDPENCRWSTPEMQGGNRRNNQLCDGITQGELRRRLAEDPEYGARAAMRDMQEKGKDVL